MTDRTWYLIVAGIVGVFLSVILAVGAFAQVQESHPVSATVDINTIVRGDPGYTETVKMLTPFDLDAEPGWVCDVVGFGDNGESTHPDTNAIVSSNGDSVIILDWERVANTRTEATNGTLTLGATITVAIQVGEDRVASGGLEIRFTCNPQQPPPITTTTSSTLPESSTTLPPETTTTVGSPSTTLPVTTTTEPPPINGIDTGGGACAGGACTVASYAFEIIAGVLALGAAAVLGLAVVIGGRRRR